MVKHFIKSETLNLQLYNVLKNKIIYNGAREQIGH